MTTAAPNQPRKREDEKYDGVWMPRRDFFGKLTWAAFGAAVVGTILASVRMLFDNGRDERTPIDLTLIEETEVRALFEKISARVKGEG